MGSAVGDGETPGRQRASSALGSTSRQRQRAKEERPRTRGLSPIIASPIAPPGWGRTPLHILRSLSSCIFGLRLRLFGPSLGHGYAGGAERSARRERCGPEHDDDDDVIDKTGRQTGLSSDKKKKHRGIALVLRESAAFVHPFPLFSPLPCSLLMSSARTMGHGTLLHFRESWVLLQRGPPLPFLYFRQSSCPFSHLLRTPLRHARPSPMLLATPRNSLEGCRDTAWAC